MTKLFYTITFLALLFQAANAQNETAEAILYQSDTVKKELQELFVELSIKHPGFYRYNDKSAFDLKIDSVLNTINSPMTEFQIYRKIKPIIAQIGCLHTNIWLSDKTEKQLNSEANCLPLALNYSHGKAYITKNYSADSTIILGKEIFSINGRTIDSIYEELLRNIPMDGYNTTGKLALLEHSFPLWYRSIIDNTTSFEIEVRQGYNQKKSYTLKGIQSDQLPTYKDLMTKKLSLLIDGDVATITIPSFANSYHKANDQNFKKEIKDYFKQIKQKGITHLIVDLRGNTGGSDSNAAFFTSYFFGASFRYWDRIEAKEPIAKDIKGMKRLFYGKFAKKGDTWQHKKAAWFTREFDFYKPQKAAKNNFKGKTFVMIDGLCMSSCSDVAAILDFNDKATFMGTETGGGYQGNTSGLIPEEQLSFGVTISVPLLSYYNAVDTANFGRGTMPDKEFSLSIEDVLKKDDLILKKAKALIIK